jgi:hypothetical protein
LIWTQGKRADALCRAATGEPVESLPLPDRYLATYLRAENIRPLPEPNDADIKVIRRDRLGRLIHEYAQAA